jgi:hypothetical protein
VLFEQPDAVARFQHLAETASSAGKLYALAGLQLLDRPAASRLRRMLAEESGKIVVFDSDVVWDKPVEELAGFVERRGMGAQFRKVRDEVNAHYATARSHAGESVFEDAPAPLTARATDVSTTTQWPQGIRAAAWRRQSTSTMRQVRLFHVFQKISIQVYVPGISM